MFSKWRDDLRGALGLRIALWYAVIFVASAFALVAVTYVLLAASLRAYDRDTIESALLQYARAYVRGGVRGIATEIRARRRAHRRGRTGAVPIRWCRGRRPAAMPPAGRT